MLGTPNMGSPCAYWINTILDGIPTRQLRPDFVAGFNQRVLNRKGVVFSILAGDVNLRTCGSTTTGDSVVEVPSAHWILGDRVTTSVYHTSMTSDQHSLDTYVKPRLALDPDEVKKLTASAAAASAGA